MKLIDLVYIGLLSESLPKHSKNKGERDVLDMLRSGSFEVSKRLRLYVEPVLRCGEPTSSRSDPAFRLDQKQAQCGSVWKMLEICRTVERIEHIRAKSSGQKHERI